MHTFRVLCQDITVINQVLCKDITVTFRVLCQDITVINQVLCQDITVINQVLCQDITSPYCLHLSHHNTRNDEMATSLISSGLCYPS